MQVTMWVILGATLGLAQLVVVHSNRVPSITLGAMVRLGPLNVRIPQGWEFQKARSSSGFILVANDPDNTRRLFVRAFSKSAADETPEQSETPALITQALQFKNLNQTGRLQVFQVPRQTPEGIIRIELLKGDVVLPSGLAVEIDLEQYGPRVDPADWILVRQLANAIMLSERAAPAPRSDDSVTQVIGIARRTSRIVSDDGAGDLKSIQGHGRVEI